SMQRGSFQMMKSVNKSLILNTIRLNQPTSRAEIAKQVKLTPPTVSAIVKELIEEKIVEETELGQSKGGRKPTMLQINDQQFNMIGIDIGPSKVHSILTDLSGHIIERHTADLAAAISEDAFFSLLKKMTDHMIAAAPHLEHIIGIGVAMHGVVDIQSGKALFAPNLNLNNIPIKAYLESMFKIPVYVENDARAMALGESWFGHHQNPHSMLVINLSTGVGAGIIVNGELFHGYDDLAGEVGHMTIDMDGPLCKCGNKGCFQTFATGKAIVREVNTLLKEDQYTLAEDVHEDAKNGDASCIKALQHIGSSIGVALTNLIHIINPQVIVLGGGVTKASDFLLPTIKKEIQDRALTNDAKETTVKITDLGKNATLYGAIALVLKDVFE